MMGLNYRILLNIVFILLSFLFLKGYNEIKKQKYFFHV